MRDGKPGDADLYLELIGQGDADRLRRLVAERPDLLAARAAQPEEKRPFKEIAAMLRKV